MHQSEHVRVIDVKTKKSPVRVKLHIRFLFRIIVTRSECDNNKDGAMFKKYMSKLTNTVGTVNYLNKLTKDKDLERDPRYTRNVLILDLSAAADVAAGQLLEPMTPELEETHTILSAAIADLRNTLLFYPLVLLCFCFWRFFSFLQKNINHSPYNNHEQ